MTIAKKQRYAATLIAIVSTCPGASQAVGQIVQRYCKPALTIRDTSYSTPSFSAPVNLQRIWRATIEVNASHCATKTGLFAVEFIRGKEYGQDVAFTMPFMWRAGQTEIRVDFWNDESVENFHVVDIATCPCWGY